jgi:hypothetical protein
MPQDNQRASLRDVLNYEPEQYLSADELALIKSTFKDNQKLLNVLRKVMLPTISDPSLPVEEVANDSLLAGVDWQSMPSEHVKAILQGRQEAIKFIAGGLIRLRMLSSESEESPYQKALRMKKDSAK